MNTKFLKPFLALSLIAFFAVSCDKENQVQEDPYIGFEETNEIIKLAFVDDFNETFQNSLKSSKNKTSEVFASEEAKRLFIEHFSEYKVEIEGEMYNLKECKDLTPEDLYNMTLDKIIAFENYNLNSANLLKAAQKDVTREEIRAAFKKECDKYIWLISDSCKLAVDIAYLFG